MMSCKFIFRGENVLFGKICFLTGREKEVETGKKSCEESGRRISLQGWKNFKHLPYAHSINYWQVLTHMVFAVMEREEAFCLYFFKRGFPEPTNTTRDNFSIISIHTRVSYVIHGRVTSVHDST